MRVHHLGQDGWTIAISLRGNRELPGETRHSRDQHGAQPPGDSSGSFGGQWLGGSAHGAFPSPACGRVSDDGRSTVARRCRNRATVCADFPEVVAANISFLPCAACGQRGLDWPSIRSRRTGGEKNRRAGVLRVRPWGMACAIGAPITMVMDQGISASPTMPDRGRYGRPCTACRPSRCSRLQLY